MIGVSDATGGQRKSTQKCPLDLETSWVVVTLTEVISMSTPSHCNKRRQMISDGSKPWSPVDSGRQLART